MKRLIFTFILLFLYIKIFSQEALIILGKNNIASNEYFTITLQVNNDNMKSYSPLPEIKGFTKRGTSSSASTNIINGRISSSHSIVTNFLPMGEGTFVLPPFSVMINGKEVKSNGTTIKVGAPVQQQNPNFFDFNDPFADFFGRGKSQTQEYVNVNADAFFDIITNKEVYIGQGFNFTMAFYVAESNRAQMNFYDLQNQLPELLKKVKPKDCWEENFGVSEITPVTVVINGKKYTQYKFYEAVFYPLNNKTIKIPSVELKMIKYDVSKNPSFFGQNRKETISSFGTKAKTIMVKDLPPHPLRDVVPVGDYKLIENVSKQNLNTEEGLNFTFNVTGEGNISGISNPEVTTDKLLEIYNPDINQTINRANGRVTGSKKFNYFISPYEPGNYKLNNYFSFIYFNPFTSRYDTLFPQIEIFVSGESRKNSSIISSDLGSFYNRISAEDNVLRFGFLHTKMKFVTMILLCVFAVFLFIIFRK